jgi:gas vesicle protein
MKSKSVLFLLSGFAIGAITGLLIVPQRSIKSRKELKKSKKYKKAFKETASKYKQKLAGTKENVQPAADTIKKKTT